MPSKRKTSAKTLPSQVRGNDNPFGLLVECAPIKSIELDSSLAVLTEGWDWGEGITVNLNTSKARLNLEFLNDEGTSLACILEGFEYFEKFPAKSDGPRGVMMVEGKTPMFFEKKEKSLGIDKAGKLVKPVVIGSTAYQYAAIILTKGVSDSEFRMGIVCFAIKLPDRILPTQKDRFKCFCIWLNQWWDKHVVGIVKKKDDERKQLMVECYNPEGIDPWKNQRTVLRNLMAEDYPKLFAAWGKRKFAKSEEDKKRGLQEIKLAYIVDQTAITGKRPSIAVEEELWGNDTLIDDFILKLAQSMKGKVGSKTNSKKWWLAINWTEKKLFKMNDKQLAKCFKREVNQTASGHDLRENARRVGLIFLLKRGPKQRAT